MAGLLNILSVHSYVLFHNNKITNLKAFFVHNFNIQITNIDLLNKWITHRFNIYTAINIKDYKLWACIQIDFKKFEAKYFNILNNNT